MRAIAEVGLAVLIAGAIAFYLASAWFTWRFFQPKPSSPSVPETTHLPPVSILMSVRGLDAGAWENWVSFCTQNYPTYEVLFGVTDGDDPCVPFLQKLMDTYPEKVRLFTGLEPRGINLKDSNLDFLLGKAQSETLVFTDSDIRVPPDYLLTVTAPLADPPVGMVTCAYLGYHPQSLGAAVASFGRGFDFIPGLLISQAMDGGLRCAVGTTIATRRAALTDYGGLALNRIGSDYNLGKRAAQAGYQVQLSRSVLESDTGQEGLGEVFQRELRWARTIRFNRGAQYYTMIVCYGTVYCVPLLLLAGFAPWSLALAIATWGIRLIQVLVSIHSLQAPNLYRWLWALPLREVLSFLIWAIGGYGQRVHWRGRLLKIEADGLISEWQSPNRSVPE